MCKYSKIFLTVCFSLLLLKLSYSRQFRIAWMAPQNTHHGLNASSSVGSLILALKALEHSDALFMANHSISVRWFNTDCNPKAALASVMQAKDEFKPDVFIGPPCTSAMRMVGMFASIINKPVIGWVSNDIEFSNKTTYSTLVRLAAPLNRLSSTMMRIVSGLFHWKRYSMIHDKGSQYKAVADTIRENKEISIIGVHEVSINLKESDIERIFQQVRKHSRIIILAVPWHTLRRYMVVAHRLGMSNGDFAFLCIHGDLFTREELKKDVLSDTVWRRNDADDEAARKAFESVIQIMPAHTKEELDKNFRELIANSRNQSNSLWNLPSSTEPDAYSMYLYDAMMVWALTVKKLLKENKTPSDGKLFFNTTINMNYPQGLTGPIAIDQQGDRLPNIWMLDMQPNGKFAKVLGVDFTKTGTRIDTNESSDKLIHWPNGKVGLKNAPLDVPDLKTYFPIKRNKT